MAGDEDREATASTPPGPPHSRAGRHGRRAPSLSVWGPLTHLRIQSVIVGLAIGVWLFGLGWAPILKHDFNTAQWMLHSWWLLEDPTAACTTAAWSRHACWYYGTHPPLVHTFGVPGLLLVGWETWPIRGLQAAITLWGALELRSLAQRLWGPTAATVTLGLMLLPPMMLHYGQIPNYEPTVAALIAASANRIDLALRHGGRARWALIGQLALLSFLTDWSAYHGWGALALLCWGSWAVRRWGRWDWVRRVGGLLDALGRWRWHVAGVVALGCLVFAAHLGLLVAYHGSPSALFDTAERRGQGGTYLLSVVWWAIMAWRVLTLWALVPVVLGVGGLWVAWGWTAVDEVARDAAVSLTDGVVDVVDGRGFDPVWAARLVPLVLLAPAVLHTVLFSEGAQAHEFWTLPAVGGLALAGGWWLREASVRKVLIVLGLLVLIGAADVWRLHQAWPDAVESAGATRIVGEHLPDGSDVLVELGLVASRPEGVWMMHTGRVTVWEGAVSAADVAAHDAALVCGVHAPETGIELIAVSEHPTCEGGTVVLIRAASG